MMAVLSWLEGNPSVLASVASAVIAASVALIVFAITQFLTAKRNRAALSVPKLEELYLVLNEIAADNATVSALAFRAIDGDNEARAKLLSMSELDLYGHRTAKRMIMYIRLYFPKLGRIHQLLFAAQRDVDLLLFDISSGRLPVMADMLEAAGMVSHFVRLMENEIVNNRDRLVGDRLWPPRYRQSTHEELNAVPPVPEGPLWGIKQETPD
ncbi:MAG: hypothetical protein JWR80_9157 [Bradyrhizobium sp.]|nr:hypothetical protein [Bradyrhizobium sp.]